MSGPTIAAESRTNYGATGSLRFPIRQRRDRLHIMDAQTTAPLNGHASQSLDEIRQEIELLEARNHLLSLKERTKLRESYYGYTSNQWGELVDPLDAYRDAELRTTPLGGASRHDRQDGYNRPFVWAEVDLDLMRGQARWIANMIGTSMGVLANLQNYTIRTGFKYDVRPAPQYLAEPVALRLGEIAQQVVDEFQALNVLGEDEQEQYTWADRERSSFLDAVIDGDAFIRAFDQGDGTTLVRPMAAEQVRQPAGTGKEYAFGIHTQPGDIERVIGYCVAYSSPEDWEEVPSRDVVHFKRNVPTYVKRGLSDFYSTQGSFRETEKMLRNMRITGATQSALAWIEQFDAATGSALEDLRQRRSDSNRPQYTDPFSGKVVDSEKITPGSVKLIQAGRTYLPSPLASNTSNHLAIVDASLRAMAQRWCMPEYMISANASNANFASTLVAGSPFVTSVECEQRMLAQKFKRILWIAIRNAARAGRFLLAGHRYTYSDLSKLLDIQCTPPQVAIANREAEARIDHQDLQDGVMSIPTRRARRGLDDATERKLMREEPLTRAEGRVTDLDPSGNPIRGQMPLPAPPGSAEGSQAMESLREDLRTALAAPKGEHIRVERDQDGRIVGWSKMPEPIREDRSGLVQQVVTDKNGVDRHVWVRPEEAGQSRQPAKADKPASSTASSMAPAVRDHAAKIAASLRGNDSLDDGQRKAYFRAATNVLQRMSPKALDRFTAGLPGGIVFAASTGAVKEAIAGLGRISQDRLDAAGEIAGAYTAGHDNKRQLILDGDRKQTAGLSSNDARTAEAIYAHEMSHAIDGPDHEVSKSAEWQAAFQAELAGKQLTRYAATKPSEGFAEFGRAVLSGNVDHAVLEKHFPKCLAVWRGRGLLESLLAGPQSMLSLLRESLTAEGVLDELFAGWVEEGNTHADVLLDDETLTQESLSPDWVDWDWRDVSSILQEAARKPGEKWQGPSGRWFTVRDDGRVVPAAGPKSGTTGQKTGTAQRTIRGTNPAVRPQGMPTVSSVKADIEGLQTSDKPLDAMGHMTSKMMHLTVKELHSLKKDLAVAASGAKAELVRKILERALSGPKSRIATAYGVTPAPAPAPAPTAESKPAEGAYGVKPAEVPVQDRGPAIPPGPKLPSLAERLDRITAREQSGRAPYIDMLITKLKHDRVVPADAPPASVFRDIQAISTGNAPHNERLTPAAIGAAAKGIAPDVGKLTGSEVLRIAPYMRYPEQVGRGVAGREVIAQRYIPVDILQAMKGSES